MIATDLDRVAHALDSLDRAPDSAHPTGVLVVSKDLDARLALAHYLEGLGCDVWTATCGTDAYDIGIRHPTGIALMVCDASLPARSVQELYGRLKARRPALQCCVLADEQF
jgi:CheY-like chemotaxis protein